MCNGLQHDGHSSRKNLTLDWQFSNPPGATDTRNDLRQDVLLSSPADEGGKTCPGRARPRHLLYGWSLTCGAKSIMFKMQGDYNKRVFFCLW